MKDVICPYCLSKLTPSSIIRRCNICSSPMKSSFSNNLKIQRGIIPRCDDPKCHGQFSVLYCPTCSARNAMMGKLPSDIVQYNKYLRFALVGPSSCGKTNYLTTMLTELKQNRTLRFNVSAMDEDTKKYYDQNYIGLYHNKKELGNTDAVHPMQWSIQDQGRMTQKTVPCYSMTIFDGAGEVQARITSVTDETMKSYISGSKMIMLLVDPLKLYGIVQKLGREKAHRMGAELNISREYTADFINGIIRYLKESLGKKVTQKIEIPVAVVIGKMDLMEELLPPGMEVSKPSGHAKRGVYCISEATRIHAEIQSWLTSCDSDLDGIFNSNFTTWQYFGVSSYGLKPKDGEVVGDILPLRVLDPLIWNFYLEKIVESVNE